MQQKEPDAGEAVQDPHQLAHHAHVRLAEEDDLLRVQAACQEVDRHAAHAFAELVRLRLDGQRMQVGDEDDRVVALLLKAHGGADRPEIISDMKDA